MITIEAFDDELDKSSRQFSITAMAIAMGIELLEGTCKILCDVITANIS